MSDSSKITVELFREFEKEVLRILVIPHLGAEAVKSIEDEAEFVSYEHSGCGYFLTVRQRNVSRARVVCGKPIVAGRVDNTNCGFIAFMENGDLMLECYGFGDQSLPKDIRDLNVVVSTT
jgi:hypothetical protein